MAVIAGTATATFGLAPAEAALRAVDPPAATSAGNGELSLLATSAQAAGSALPQALSAKPIVDREATADGRKSDEVEADVQLDETPRLSPAVETTIAGATADDPSPDGDASPVVPQPDGDSAAEPTPS